MMTFSTVSSLVSEIYKVEVIWVNSCITVFLIMTIIMNFPSVPIIERCGLSVSFRVAAFVTILGSWLRYFCLRDMKSFYWMLAPQMLVATVCPILTNGISKMAYRWFADDEVAVAISFGALGAPLGCIVGVLLGPQFIDETKATKAQVEYYVLWHAIMDTAMCLPLILFFRNHPKHFPSAFAQSRSKHCEQYSFRGDMSLLSKNSNIWWFVLNFGIIHGVYACLGATVNNVVRPFKYTAMESALFGGVCLSSGLVASFFFSKYLDRAQDKISRLLFILKIISIGSLLSFMALVPLLKPNNTVLVSIDIALIGIFMVPIMPVGYYAAVELSKPVSEAMSSGLIMLFGMIYAIAMIYVVSVTCSGGKDREEDADGVRIVLASTNIFLALACVAIFRIKVTDDDDAEERKVLCDGLGGQTEMQI